jgi:hypothetical protein
MAVDPAKIVAQVLELAELEDWVAILNIAAPSPAAHISTSSPVPQMRKLYLKLSLVIHPDRLGKKVPDATRAFQSLVLAFERLSSPELIEEVEVGKKKGAPKPVAIARANEGCFRTRVCCPRCKQPWNEGSLDGNPDYCYNFLMTGLKQYTCSTCLCEFGCMTAIHKCPGCTKEFEYDPSLYHTKIKCGREKCSRKFGFMMYHCSDRMMKETKAGVKEELLRRSKAKEAKLRRANRSASRGGDSGEAAFSLGLSDVCPRCGEDFTEFGNEEDQRMHLMECSDSKKQGEFKSKKDKEGVKKQEKEVRAAKQEAAQNLAAVQCLGGGNTMLWLLDADQLRSQAGSLKLDTNGDKDDLISRIVSNSGSSSSSSSSSGAIMDSKKRKNNELVVSSSKKGSSASNALVVGGGRDDEDFTSSIPSDFHGRSAAQLKSMCACHGLLAGLPKNATKSDYVEALEAAMYDV